MAFSISPDAHNDKQVAPFLAPPHPRYKLALVLCEWVALRNSVKVANAQPFFVSKRQGLRLCPQCSGGQNRVKLESSGCPACQVRAEEERTAWSQASPGNPELEQEVMLGRAVWRHSS